MSKKEVLVRTLVSGFRPGSYPINEICDKIRRKHPQIWPNEPPVVGEVIDILKELPLLFKVSDHHPIARRLSPHF